MRLSNVIFRLQTYDYLQGSLYYRHKQSGLTKWDIPSAVRTYLSIDSEAKVRSYHGNLLIIQAFLI
jgi:hypothetical protein